MRILPSGFTRGEAVRSRVKGGGLQSPSIIGVNTQRAMICLWVLFVYMNYIVNVVKKYISRSSSRSLLQLASF